MEATATNTAVSGATEEARFAGPTAMSDIAAGTGVHAGAKGINPTPSNPRTDRDKSEVRRPTAKELGWYECWRRGKRMGGYDRKMRGDGTEKEGHTFESFASYEFGQIQILEANGYLHSPCS